MARGGLSTAIMQGPYADYILDARDVCSNCFRKNRVARVDPVRGGLGRDELDSHYERDRRETTVEYAPHDIPHRSKGVFCACGVEGSHERLWDPTDVERAQFKRLLQNSIRALERKEVSIKRKEAAMYALSHFDEHDDVDRALATGLELGIVAAAASAPSTTSVTI